MSASELWLCTPRPEAMDAQDPERWLERWLGDMLGIRVRLVFGRDGRAVKVPAGARVAYADDGAFLPPVADDAVHLSGSTASVLGLAWERLRRGHPGDAAVPAIDLGVADIERRIDRGWPELARIPRVPLPYRCALVLTHDVDAVDRWTPQHVAHLARHVRERVGFEGARAVLRLPWAAVRRAWDRPAIEARIHACLELERRHGAHASYLFFSPETRHRQALDGWYTPRTRFGRGDVAELWRGMNREGFEVGLHLSIGAHGDTRAVAAEWNALRAFTEHLASCRSHYLKVVPGVTAAALASAGARVDLNLVATGYPQGTGAPFRHADSGIYCLPTVIEDGELPVDGAGAAVLDRVWAAWERVLTETRRHESVATVLLHPGKADAPAMLERLLRWGQANDAWMTSAARFIEHWHRRAADIDQARGSAAHAQPVAADRGGPGA
jgi:hypothetical protein